ncbi:Estrogen receptor beta like 1 [Fasciolopsis buskii]|uniref:Estrogen receptor beta like 1 n=1 Tax=Fasciolopsis buskii TaxID=27845 RepID=A0A8E0RRK6_9TREM|nr:Estrogen receptor beta like 1 [Fasciolopsis buski]
MSAEKTKTSDGADDAPVNTYLCYNKMEILSEKLKLLNYEKEFCRVRHRKPVPRHYFAIPTNPGEQFHSFTTLAAWLIGQANGKIDPPQEYDDPNATIATILDAVRELGHTVEFAPSKLKSGCGEHCIEVLTRLADSALKIKGHEFRLPNYVEEDDDGLNIEEADLSNTDEDFCEWRGTRSGGRCVNNRAASGDEGPNRFAELDDDDDEDVLDLEALKTRGSRFARSSINCDGNELNRKIRSPVFRDNVLGEKNSRGPIGVLESTTDPADWQLEVERVLPQLRITIRNDSKDWRAHLEDMRRYQSDIDRAYGDAKTQLTRLHAELGRALDKISSREKYMNSQLETLLSQYKMVQDSLSEVTQRFRQASGGITERSRILAEIGEELERVKDEMDERGSSMTDGSPVVRIKQAIQKLKSEIIAMDIRTGVLEHILLRMHLRVREDSQKPLFCKQSDLSRVDSESGYAFQ